MKLREIVYMILDELKLFSDDATYTEDHIKFLVGKHRALLLQQQQQDSKNLISPSNYQALCIDLEQAQMQPVNPFPGSIFPFCPHQYNYNVDHDSNSIIVLKSTVKIPTMMSQFTPQINTTNFFLSNIVFITSERMKFVGYNKFMRNIIYCAIGSDGYLYMTSNNRGYENLEHIVVNGIFEDFEAAAELSCEDANVEDPLDAEFPLDPALTPQLVQNVLKELLGSIYRPKDPANNANDDLADLASFMRQNLKSKLAKQIADDD